MDRYCWKRGWCNSQTLYICILGTASCWPFPLLLFLDVENQEAFSTHLFHLSQPYWCNYCFCSVIWLKWSWYRGLLHRCKGLNSSSPVACHSALPWYRKRLWGVGGRGCESQRTVSSPAFCFPFFLTAGPSHLRSLEGKCSLFSALQMNAPLAVARHGGLLVSGYRVARVSRTSVLIWPLPV